MNFLNYKFVHVHPGKRAVLKLWLASMLEIDVPGSRLGISPQFLSLSLSLFALQRNNRIESQKFDWEISKQGISS
jgi:hypothetical protein